MVPASERGYSAEEILIRVKGFRVEHGRKWCAMSLPDTYVVDEHLCREGT
jgi:hypothetical protein